MLACRSSSETTYTGSFDSDKAVESGRRNVGQPITFVIRAATAAGRIWLRRTMSSHIGCLPPTSGEAKTQSVRSVGTRARRRRKASGYLEVWVNGRVHIDENALDSRGRVRGARSIRSVARRTHPRRLTQLEFWPIAVSGIGLAMTFVPLSKVALATVGKRVPEREWHLQLPSQRRWSRSGSP